MVGGDRGVGDPSEVNEFGYTFNEASFGLVFACGLLLAVLAVLSFYNGMTLTCCLNAVAAVGNGFAAVNMKWLSRQVFVQVRDGRVAIDGRRFMFQKSKQRAAFELGEVESVEKGKRGIIVTLRGGGQVVVKPQVLAYEDRAQLMSILESAADGRAS